MLGFLNLVDLRGKKIHLYTCVVQLRESMSLIALVHPVKPYRNLRKYNGNRG